ncbi:hypothetical protein DNH61_16560 [Paenibacillus sambharensis]|uniref:Uncharacterized protein n=1 Tax=Paenibacillus sambharensis TaxID=1803190 RepID=A0A2W1L6Y5_9BACL|nr:hypothetical protein [Paenibacillus sambharensis]PZD94579.1 hypothetical protein DNH61_16560 [Paenibacillus sambharensis]
MKNDKKTAAEMLDYVQTKYGGSFTAEAFEESGLMPELYGSDKMMVHPAGQPELPFYVYKKGKTDSYTDNYLEASLSVHYTDKHIAEVMQLDERDIAVKFRLGFAGTLDDKSLLDADPDTALSAISHPTMLYLYTGVKGSKGDNRTESEFLHRLYRYMMELTDRDFTVVVAYIDEEDYEKADRLLRIAHTVNFSWSMLDDPEVSVAWFERGDDVQDASFFLQRLGGEQG